MTYRKNDRVLVKGLNNEDIAARITNVTAEMIEWRQVNGDKSGGYNAALLPTMEKMGRIALVFRS